MPDNKLSIIEIILIATFLAVLGFIFLGFCLWLQSIQFYVAHVKPSWF